MAVPLGMPKTPDGQPLVAVPLGMPKTPDGQPQGAVPTIGEADIETSKSVIPDRSGYNCLSIPALYSFSIPEEV